ncbi:MAG: hypothetical protein IT531_05230 [Burkholderiales bacterium]|nr:hypothetical protein [Burkholderiales bacterium]
MRMRTAASVTLAAWLAAAATSFAQATTAPARVFGEELRCEPAPNDSARACARRILRIARDRIEQDFIRRHGLGATADEVEALHAYNRAFEAQDRDQRARKLLELEGRLANADLDASERARLREFHAVLVRLARYEADVDAGSEVRIDTPVEVLRRWIEYWKLNDALYARYGGVVGLTASGPYAHGARALLIERSLARAEIEILDPVIEQHLRAELAAQPRMRFRGAVPDFTPFWKRPIPASYIAP